MTRQESFKRRVRARMAKTGEKYGAARRALIAGRASGSSEGHGGVSHPWVSQPHPSDDRVREATGRGWEEWRQILDDWPGHDQGHQAIVAHLVGAHGVPGWWAQTVTLGYERISGLRLPNQLPDGSFSANKSRTVDVDPEMLKSMLLDADSRADLFPGIETELRSRPGSKTVRIAIGPGVALIAIDPRDDGRVRVSVAHERLPEPDDVEEWKMFWGEWLGAIDESKDSDDGRLT